MTNTLKMPCIFCMGGTLEIPSAKATPHEQAFALPLQLLERTCRLHRASLLVTFAQILANELHGHLYVAQKEESA